MKLTNIGGCQTYPPKVGNIFYVLVKFQRHASQFKHNGANSGNEIKEGGNILLVNSIRSVLSLVVIYMT